MSKYIQESLNETVLRYHLLFPAKHKRVVFDVVVEKVLQKVCLEIEKRYQVHFSKVGTDKDHLRFLVQPVPTYSVAKLVTLMKSISALEILRSCPQVMK